MIEASPTITFTGCAGAISTLYQFESPGFQTAATTVYLQKSTFDSLPENRAKGKVYTFKTQGERMQYVIGSMANATNALYR